eukprot:gene2654-1652_t
MIFLLVIDGWGDFWACRNTRVAGFAWAHIGGCVCVGKLRFLVVVMLYFRLYVGLIGSCVGGRLF